MKRQRNGRIPNSIIRKEPPIYTTPMNEEQVRAATKAWMEIAMEGRQIQKQWTYRDVLRARPDLRLYLVILAALFALLAVKIALGAIWGIDWP